MKFFLGLLMLLLNFSAFAQNNPNFKNPVNKSFRNSSNQDLSILKQKISPTFTQILVNNKIITSNEINERLRFISKLNKVKFTSQQLQKSWYLMLAERMIDEELFRQRAQIYKIQINPSQIDNQIDIFVEKNFKNTKNFINFLLRHDLKIANFQKQIEAEIIWQKIIDEILRPSINVSMIEIREWFEKEKIASQNQKYSLRDYLIASNKETSEFAYKFYYELKSKKEFIKILDQIVNMNNRSAENMGWLWSAELNNKILEKISNLAINDFSEPVLLDDGWHIFEVCDKKTDFNLSNKELEYVKNQIINRKLEVLTKNYIDDLRKRAFIDYR